MRSLIRNMLDLSYMPTWAELLVDLAGAAAVFLIPAAIAVCAVAFGWGHP